MVKLKTKENDPINHPAHYNQGRIEVLDFIVDQKLDFLEGNIIKYICRHRFKGESLRDLKKAFFYFDRLLKEVACQKLRSDG